MSNFMENFINLTPHDIIIVGENKKVIEKSGIIARVSVNRVFVKTIDGIDLYETKYGQTIDLPELTKGTYLIVSVLVKLANPNRKDLVNPGTMIRDENGNIIGCTNLTL